MKQNEWFEATSRIAEQYITEAKPKHFRAAGETIDRTRLIEEKPAETVRQSRITRWVTTGFAAVAAVAVVVTGGVLISKVRGKVPTVQDTGTTVATAASTTETTAVSGSFQQGHDAGAADARAAVAAGTDKIIFSGTITDQVAGIYDDSLDSDMKYVMLGRKVAYSDARVIHVSRALADTLEIGKYYQFSIDERITEIDPSVVKENSGFPVLRFSFAKEVSGEYEYNSDSISFSRAEVSSSMPEDYLNGYQEGYRDVLLNLDVQKNYCRLDGSLTAYVRDVLEPDLEGRYDDADAFANMLVVAESPDHKTYFPVFYPYKNRAELVKDQLVTFILTQTEENAVNQAQYLSDRLIEKVDPSEVAVIFDSVREPNDGEFVIWNRLNARKQYQDDPAETTETTTATEPDNQTETKTWQMGDVRYSSWTVLRSGNTVQFEQYNEPGQNAHSAELTFSGSTAVTKMKKAKSVGELYTEAVPAFDGEKHYILKDGQVISTDGSTVLMTGIRPEVNQHFSLYTVEKLRDGCWFVCMSEGWENGGGWINEYWCDGKGKAVKIEAANTPAYSTIVAEDGSCVYYVDLYGNDGDGITRVNPFEATGKLTVKGDAVRAVQPDGEGPDGCFTDTGHAFFCGGSIYIPLGGNGDGGDCGYLVVDPEGGKAPKYLEQAGLYYMFEAGGKVYGITGAGVLAEYLPETNKSRKVADIRAAFAAAAKDGANAEIKQALTELSGSWMPYNNNFITAVWDDAVILHAYFGESEFFVAVNLQTGAVQLLTV